MSLQTTIAGSLPKPRWLATPDQLWAGWVQSGEDFPLDQELAWLAIVTDGEQNRQHFVTTFIEALDGVDGLNRANVIIRCRYEASVPRVVGEVSRRGEVYVDAPTPSPLHHESQDQDAAPRSHDHGRHPSGRLLRRPGEAGDDLRIHTQRGGHGAGRRRGGCHPVRRARIQRVPRRGAGWGIEALEAAVAGLKATTAVHICYGYGVKANIEWKQGLGPEWRQYEATFPVLAESTIDQVSLEIAGSRVPLEVLDLLGDKSVQAGVIDVATDRVESPAEVAATIAAVADHISPERIFPSTNCGMVPLTRPVAVGKMSALARGARLAG